MFIEASTQHLSRIIAPFSLIGAIAVLVLVGGGTTVAQVDPSTSPSAAGTVVAPTTLNWKVETVDSSTGTVYFGNSLELDPNGRPHLVYYDPGAASLVYAYRDSTWHATTVDETADVGTYNSLALDSDGHLHVSYYDASAQHLKYARYDGSGWTPTTVDAATYAGRFSSIAVDSADNPWISYYRGGACGTDAYCNLRYATYDGAWDPRQLHLSTADVGRSSSIAFDSHDHPHVSYYDATNGNLRYLHHDGSSWSTWHVVDSAGNVGSDTSLALDLNDRPYIAYWNVDERELMVAHHDGTGWITQTVDSEHAGRSASLALDSSGRPHVSYYDMGSDTLKYAYHDGYTWHTETVAGTGNVNGYEGTSLALDGAGLPHIRFYTTSGLRYAYVEPSRIYLPLVLNAYPAPPERYAVVIGVADYMYDDTSPPWCFLDDLPYPDDDAQAMRQILLDVGGFEPSNILTLIDTQATRAAIQDAITNWLASRAGPNDLVVIAYHGHGGQLGDSFPYGDEADGVDEWLIPTDYDCTVDTAISDDELDTWLDTVDSQHVVLLIDSCFSGGLFGATVADEGSCHCRCLPPPPGVVIERTADPSLPMDIGQSGRLVLTASREDQESFECDSLHSGVFSYYLRQSLQASAADTHDHNGWVSGEEAYDYLKPRVEAEMCYQPWFQNPQISDGTAGEEDLAQP